MLSISILTSGRDLFELLPSSSTISPLLGRPETNLKTSQHFLKNESLEESTWYGGYVSHNISSTRASDGCDDLDGKITPTVHWIDLQVDCIYSQRKLTLFIVCSFFTYSNNVLARRDIRTMNEMFIWLSRRIVACQLVPARTKLDFHLICYSTVNLFLRIGCDE